MTRHLFFLFLCAFLLMACATKKTTMVEDIATHTQHADTSAVVAVHDNVIDTAWWDAGTYTHTIITFEPDTLPSQRPESSVDAVGVVTIGGINITGRPGKIKTIDQTTIEKNTGGHVTIAERDSTSEVHGSQEVADVDKHKQVVKTPVCVVRPWMVVALAILAILLAVMFKRFGVWAFIRRVIDYIRNLI